MEKIIHKLINDFTEGVDTYTHNGSTWLIFTESKQWVIELTDGKTLWYNYNFFKGIFSYTSMDVVDNQQYITKWVEDNIIGGVKKTLNMSVKTHRSIEDTLVNGVKENSLTYVGKQIGCDDALENGVRHTEIGWHQCNNIDDAIEKGVKETNSTLRRTLLGVDDIIQNGVKETKGHGFEQQNIIDDIVKDGVKETIECNWNIPKYVINEVLNDGVKHTEYGDWLDGDERLDDIINNGVRDTQSNPYENESWIEGVIKKGVRHTFNTEYMPTSMVEDIIQSGVKETNPVDVMKFFDNKMEDALQNGVKETKQKKNAYLVLDTSGRELILESHLVIRDGVKETNYDTDNYTDDVKEVIREGVRTSHPRQYVGEIIIDKVIDNGVIETHDDAHNHKDRIDGVIKNGIKETKTPGNGDIVAYIEWMKESKTNSYTKMIDDVIDYGEKINGTYAGGQRQSEKCKSVVEYGTKNPTD